MKYISPLLLLLMGIASFTIGSYTLSLLPLFHWAREVVILVSSIIFVPCFAGSILWAYKVYLRTEEEAK